MSEFNSTEFSTLEETFDDELQQQEQYIWFVATNFCLKISAMLFCRVVDIVNFSHRFTCNRWFVEIIRVFVSQFRWKHRCDLNAFCCNFRYFKRESTIWCNWDKIDWFVNESLRISRELLLRARLLKWIVNIIDVMLISLRRLMLWGQICVVVKDWFSS